MPVALLDELDSTWFASLRRSLVRWYEKHGRDLPWRRTRDPYHIWISEIMLQQTTVAAVIPYFERFLDRFPTVHELAAADEQEVLRLWEGLGYYSRARNIHKAAKLITGEFNGQFPTDAESLNHLPGIGRYTAGAIASFAFDTAAPIVEANTLRLYCRLLGFDGDPRAKAGQDLLWSFAERVLPRKSPGRMNQALMELGGTLCSVKQPSCNDCPVRKNCRAFADQTTNRIPQPKQRPKVTQLTHANLIVRKAGKVLIRQHTADERWAGLWDFPRYELSATLCAKLPLTFTKPDLFGDIVTIHEALQVELVEQTKIDAKVTAFATELSHTVTRYRIRLLCFEAEYEAGRLRGDGTKWVRPSDLSEYPLTMTARKMARFA